MELQPFVTEREWAVEGIPVLTAAISVPEPTAADRLSRRIRRYYQMQMKAYLHYCEKWLLPQAKAEYDAALSVSAPLPCYSAKLDYCITYQEQGLLSLYTQSTEKTHQTVLTRRGDTWDMNTGYPVPLSDFFVPKSSWRKKLLQLAAEEIERLKRAGFPYDRANRYQLARTFNSQNYYLTAEGLVFFFPMYAIAAASVGIPAFVLPYDAEILKRPPSRKKDEAPQKTI